MVQDVKEVLLRRLDDIEINCDAAQSYLSYDLEGSTYSFHSWFEHGYTQDDINKLRDAIRSYRQLLGADNNRSNYWKVLKGELK